MRTLLPLEADAEITLEANPGTAEAQKFADFRAAGRESAVARHPELQPAPSARRWGASTTTAKRGAPSSLRHAISTTFNLDLMYALPEQTLAEALADISTRRCRFGPQHLSAYHLTLEPNTLFSTPQPPIAAG